MKRGKVGVELLVHLVLLTAVVVFVWVVFFRANSQPYGPVSGTQVLGLEEVVGEEHGETLLLTLSPSCVYCLLSRGFYKQIIDSRNERGAALRVVVAVDTSRSIAVQKRLLSEEHIVPDTIVAIPFREAGIFGVPTAMSLDERGAIEDVWIGQLDSLQQVSLMRAVGLGVPSASAR